MEENKVEQNIKQEKRMLHPAFTFSILAIAIVIISGITSALGLKATYMRINPTTNELQPYLVTVESLLSREGLQYIVSSILKNFMSFAPLAMSLMFLMALGVAEKSGFIRVIIRKTSFTSPKWVNTFLLFFGGIILSAFNEMAYIIVIPLSALFFLYNNRNPLTGIVAGFASVSFGYSINIITNSLDILLLNYTNIAARIVDPNYHMNVYNNWLITLVVTIIFAWLGMIVTEKHIVKKTGRYNINEAIEEPTKITKRGFLYALISIVIMIVTVVYMVIPGMPYSGILLDNSETTYINQLFSPKSGFQEGLPFIISTILFIASLLYGIGAKTLKKNKDVAEAMSSYTVAVNNIVIIAFFASQFIAYFKRTNIGTIIAAWGAGIIKGIPFSGVPLLITTVLLIAIINLFVTSPTIKWALISPVVVPTLMQFNISPEFTEMLLRAGDSITNGVTILLPQFVIFIAFLNYYNNDKLINIRKSLSLMIPYSISFGIMWLILIISWYIIGLPIGIGIYPTV
ncbi:MAG: AbgT family transporter [Bacilli bacterium]|nr:AbgT family transporter [Bacilli bacterium]